MIFEDLRRKQAAHDASVSHRGEQAARRYLKAREERAREALIERQARRDIVREAASGVAFAVIVTTILVIGLAL